MRIAIVQMCSEESVDNNLEKSLNAVSEAASRGADLVLFPEVQLTEFFPQYRNLDVSDYCLTVLSEEVKAFCRACKDNRVFAVPNIYLKENEKCYDASLMIDKWGRIQGIQKMVHVAQAEKFYEQDYYEPSDTGFQVFDTEYGRIGIVVCFDRHYPESIRTEALMGADLILIPAVNTKSEPSEMFEWELRVQAFHNSVAIVMCNRVGKEGEMVFSGESIAVNADGDVISKADDKEQILYVDIELENSSKTREKKPYTRLRRADLYI